MADLCLDEYTDHGHCGLLTPDGTVDNDATLERYAEVAVAQAEAGVDICAPSGMMDGQVLAIRDALDEEGFEEVAILAYAAKYASALYGPFREAVDVEIADGGDRRAYQQDWHNVRESLEEIRADIGEGADMVMVKPALDLPRRARPGRAPRSTCRSRPTTCRVSTRWCTPPPSGAGSTATPSRSSRSPPSSARAPTWC